MDDFNVKITVRNSRVLKAIEDKFGSQAEMARQTGISNTSINQWVTMRETPVGADDWKDSARDIATALGMYPEELWPKHMRQLKLKKASASVEMSLDQVAAIMSGDDTSKQIEQRDILLRLASNVPPRSMTAIELHLQGCTFEQIGDELGVTGSRAQQIMLKGFREMRRKATRMGIRGFQDVV